MSSERQVYINGELLPESQATISIFDVGLMYGVTLYESLRTFKHNWFLQREHWRRLEKSLTYAGLQDLLDQQQFDQALAQTLEANEQFTDPDDDLWGNIQVTPGQSFPMPLMGGAEPSTPTVICYTAPLPQSDYARYYRTGKHVVTSFFRSPPAQSYDQRMKNRSRFPHFLSKRDAVRTDPDAFALMLDTDGNLAEGTGANIFVARDGVLYTPKTGSILVGTSRQYVLGLCRDLGIEAVEEDLSLYDAYTADEAFWTTSSFCILPISCIDGRPVGHAYPGPLAARLLDAWSERVGVDIVGQAERFAAS